MTPSLRYVDTIAQFPRSQKQDFGDKCLTARKLMVMPMEARLGNFCLVVNSNSVLVKKITNTESDGGGFSGSVSETAYPLVFHPK